MSRSTDKPAEPDLARFAPLIAELSEDEQRALPARLRALGRSPHTQAWNDAKAARDGAIADADAAFEAAVEKAGENGELVVAALAARNAAVREAKDTWAAAKAALLAEG